MELSGLIFVALALVWAVVLIPKALRHHDDLAQTRPVDEVSEDARVLARREAAEDRSTRLVVGPAVSTVIPTPAPAPFVSRRSAAPTPGSPQPSGPAFPSPRLPIDRVRTVVRTHRRAAAAAARRRRFVLGALLLVTGAVGAASWAAYLQPWAAVVPGGLTLAFLVVARITVRHERTRFQQAVARARRAAESAGEGPHVEPVEVAADEPTGSLVEQLAESSRSIFVTGLDDTSSFPVGLLGETAPVAAPASTLWDPLPVTLPTYVSKPRATRAVRTIDLNAPGVSSSGRDAAASALVAEAATAATDDGPGQRAVGS